MGGLKARATGKWLRLGGVYLHPQIRVQYSTLHNSDQRLGGSLPMFKGKILGMVTDTGTGLAHGQEAWSHECGEGTLPGNWLLAC